MEKSIIARTIASLIADQRGQDLAEYGIALAVIGIGAAAAALAIAGDVETLWANGQTIINSAL
jgi:Flp pilus assembly pilin Flp